MLDRLSNWADALGRAAHGYVFGLEARLALTYLVATVVLASGLWLWRGRPQSWAAWLFPRAVYAHRSNLVDAKLFLFNTVVAATGFFGALLFTPFVAVFVQVLLGKTVGAIHDSAGNGWGVTLLATVVMVLALDFCKYWAHYIHHEWRTLWHFHAVHHSAEVMTPLTAYRNHPAFIVIRNLIYSVIVGAVQGAMLWALVGRIDILTIGGANAGYVLFNLIGANLRHSHVWLSYGRVLEHVFISPAQHQIHHSIDPRHYNKNYGEVFAFWDWMFGTLYVPARHETLAFGLADAKGRRVEQPHPTLYAALVQPFVKAGRELRRRRGRAATPAAAGGPTGTGRERAS
ncbi:MAG: sterol desaturase family protein [Paracoccaceae bacterium]